MFNQDCKVGDPLNLYPEQAVNFMPPFGNKLCLAEDYVEPADEAAGGEGNDDAPKLTKAELSAKIDQVLDQLSDENKVKYKKNASVDTLSTVLEQCVLLYKLQIVNENLDEEKKVQFTNEMSVEELQKLLGDE